VLSDKGCCQLQAALFISHVYINWFLICEQGDDITAASEDRDKKFDVKKALIAVLCERDKSKAVNIQIVSSHVW